MKLIKLMVILLLTACGTSKSNGVLYNKNYFMVLTDTIEISSPHLHDENKQFCTWVEGTVVVIKDTIYKPKIDKDRWLNYFY
jgi:hypothetical protein